MSLRLRLPQITDEAEVLAAQGELGAEGFVFAFLRPGQSFGEFVKMVEDNRRGRSLDNGWVESTWLLADVDGEVVGRSSIRFELNDSLLIEGGHIGTQFGRPTGVAVTRARSCVRASSWLAPVVSTASWSRVTTAIWDRGA